MDVMKTLGMMVLALAVVLSAQGVAEAQIDGGGTHMGVRYTFINCGHVNSNVRSARSIGYDKVRPLKCRSACNVVRGWIRLDRCGTEVGDGCQFRGWGCSVGTWRAKRIVVCCRSTVRAITFTSRYR